jgi:multiple sugar transport system ATP-binding protein
VELADGTPVVAGIRPEYLSLAAPSEDGITGTVSIVENLGISSLVTLECADGTLVGLTVLEQDEPAIGTTVTAVPHPGRLLLYGEDTLLLGEAVLTKLG